MATSREVLTPAEDVLVAISGAGNSEALIRRALRLARRLGGPDIAKRIIEAAQLANVRHLFIGESRETGFWSRWRKTLADQLIDSLPDIDLHVIATEHAAVPEVEPQRRGGGHR